MRTAWAPLTCSWNRSTSWKPGGRFSDGRGGGRESQGWLGSPHREADGRGHGVDLDGGIIGGDEEAVRQTGPELEIVERPRRAYLAPGAVPLRPHHDLLRHGHPEALGGKDVAGTGGHDQATVGRLRLQRLEPPLVVLQGQLQADAVDLGISHAPGLADALRAGADEEDGLLGLDDSLGRLVSPRHVVVAGLVAFLGHVRQQGMLGPVLRPGAGRVRSASYDTRVFWSTSAMKSRALSEGDATASRTVPASSTATATSSPSSSLRDICNVLMSTGPRPPPTGTPSDPGECAAHHRLLPPCSSATRSGRPWDCRPGATRVPA